MKQQKALPPYFFRQLHHRGCLSSLHLAIGQLAIIAFFFACRSCEYTTAASERKTKTISLKNIQFSTERGVIIPHDNPSIFQAKFVSITFEEQKNAVKFERIAQQRSNDPILCPVRNTAALVTRIRSIPGTDDDTLACTYQNEKGKVCVVSQTVLLKHYRIAAEAIGEDKLGFKPEEIGTHSVRSSAAMAMFLANTPIFLIMLIGRWCSDAFLRYIRKQVLDSVQGISAKMISNDIFFTLTDLEAPPEDPRTQNPHSFATNLSSRALTSSSQRAMLPSFALHY